jgi:hypothetical protein
MHARCDDGPTPNEHWRVARQCIALPFWSDSMTKSFSLSLVVAGACLAGTGGCTASTETKPADQSEATPDETVDAATNQTQAEVEAAEGEAAATPTSGAQKRTPTGEANIHAAAARPIGDMGRRAAVAPKSASGPSHAVRPARPPASAVARTSTANGAMAKPTSDEGGAGNDVEVRGARVSRAVPAPSADGRVDNAARMIQLEAGEGESAG